MERISKREAPGDKQAVTPESDFCDLDPAKICDNCCKCLEKSDADYLDVNASVDVDSMRVYYTDDDEQDAFIGGDLPPLDIDPALLAEWEEKLHQLELEERAKEENDGGEAHCAKHDAARIRGSRPSVKKR